MKIQLIKDWKKLLAESGESQSANFFISTEKVYVVYGISIWGQYGNGRPNFEIVDDDGNLVSLPAIIATVVDHTCPNNWIVRMIEKGLVVWPEVFFRKFFFDDLSDGEPTAVRAFKELRAKMLNLDC